jgi:hypothetical protein
MIQGTMPMLSFAHFGHGDRPFRSIVIAGVGAS